MLNGLSRVGARNQDDEVDGAGMQVFRLERFPVGAVDHEFAVGDVGQRVQRVLAFMDHVQASSHVVPRAVVDVGARRVPGMPEGP